MKIAGDLLDLVGDNAFETVQDLMSVSIQTVLISLFLQNPSPPHPKKNKKKKKKKNALD